MPIAHGEGCYYADQRTLDELAAEDRIAFRYVENPNGSLDNIAGVLNRERNVLGLMPHPERASEPLMGSTDGLVVLQLDGGAAGGQAMSAAGHHPGADRAAPAYRRRVPENRLASSGASPPTPSSASSA